MDWFDDTVTALANEARQPTSDLALSSDLRHEILDLARIASHSSGDRTNAPLVCYALGLAVGRGASLEDLAGVLRSRAPDA